MTFSSLLKRSSSSGYTIAIGLLLIVGLLTYRSLTRLLDHEAQVEHTHVVLMRLETIMSLLKDAEAGQRGYLLTGEPEFLEPLQIAERRIPLVQRALDSLVAHNSLEQLRLDTLRTLVADRFVFLRTNLARYRAGQGYDLNLLLRAKVTMDHLRDLVGRWQADEERLLVLRRQRSDQYARLTYPFILALSLLIAGLASWRLQPSRAAGQRAQLESSARFAQLLENIPHMTWTSLPDGTLTYFNRQWADYTGRSVEELLSSGVRSYMHPEDREPNLAAWQRAIRTGEGMQDVRIRWRRAHDGAYRWHLGQVVPLRNVLGEIVLWVGTHTDIHAQQLQQQELERVNTDLDNFIYTASHDLKTPISNIEALLTALREELALPPQQADIPPLLDMMTQAVERFKRTIGHMTEVVKLQKAQDQPRTEVALPALVHEVCLDLAPLLTATQGRIDYDALGACPRLNFSEKNLRSILFNLLSNALKYRHPHRAPVVQLQCYPHSGYTVLSVQDNGLGLELNPAQERKLFGLFQRLHDHVEGSGIGLYMVKKIVENAGGRIEVESQLGVGSIFRVFFPQQ